MSGIHLGPTAITVSLTREPGRVRLDAGEKSVERQNRRRDLDATREKLIEAAGEVFAEQGYAAATVRDICTLAGANVAAINYHFGDKRGLYAEVLKRMTRTALIEKGHVALERNASPEEILRGFIRVRGPRLARGKAGRIGTFGLLPESCTADTGYVSLD